MVFWEGNCEHIKTSEKGPVTEPGGGRVRRGCAGVGGGRVQRRWVSVSNGNSAGTEAGDGGVQRSFVVKGVLLQYNVVFKRVLSHYFVPNKGVLSPFYDFSCEYFHRLVPLDLPF